MDDMSTRAIIIGVNIFVTITIVSLVIIMFSQMGEIYGVVANTDTSITSKFDDIYSMYNGRIETGVGLLNTLKQFEDNNEKYIVIRYPNCDNIRAYLADENQVRSEEEKIREAVYLKKLIDNKDTTYGVFKYEDKYKVSVNENRNGILQITFQK